MNFKIISVVTEEKLNAPAAAGSELCQEGSKFKEEINTLITDSKKEEYNRHIKKAVQVISSANAIVDLIDTDPKNTTDERLARIDDCRIQFVAEINDINVSMLWDDRRSALRQSKIIYNEITNMMHIRRETY